MTERPIIESWEFLPIAKFGEVSGAWRALNEATFRSPILDPLFVEPLIEHFATGRELIAVCGPREHPTAMGIVTRPAFGRLMTFQPSQAPLGAWLHRPGVDLPRLLESLLAKHPGFAVLLAVTQQDPDLTPRPDASDSILTLDYIPTARITVTGTFADYWASRGKNLRHSMKRQHNLLSRAGITPRIEVVTEPERMAAAVADYGRIESAGWKAAELNAVHADNVQGRFYSAMLRKFSEVGGARVLRCWYGDKLVATDLCIARFGTFIVLKTTYDESERTTSPAHLMRYSAFQPIFDQRQFDRIEFYGRAMDWHTKWSNEIRTMYHVNVYRWPFLKVLHARHRERRFAVANRQSQPPAQ